MNLQKIQLCKRCDLCKNQIPLTNKKVAADVMLVGLSAKIVEDPKNTPPLSVETNSGKIIRQIEDRFPRITFYETNLVKCPPLDNKNKLRYPNLSEKKTCVDNLLQEINVLKPKIVFALGKEVYLFLQSYLKDNKTIQDKLIYIEHPSYIYVYKRKFIEDYIKKIRKYLYQYSLL